MVRRARWIGAALGVAFALASPGAQSPQPSEALASLLALPISPGAIALLLPHASSSAAVERISVALAHDRPDVRAVAARVAFTTRHAALAPALVRALATETHPVAGAEEVRALWLIQGERADATIEAALPRLDSRAAGVWTETIVRTHATEIFKRLHSLPNRPDVGRALASVSASHPEAAAAAFAPLPQMLSLEPTYLALVDAARQQPDLPPWPVLSSGLAASPRARVATLILLVDHHSAGRSLPREAEAALHDLSEGAAEFAPVFVYSEMLQRRSRGRTVVDAIARIDPRALPEEFFNHRAFANLTADEAAAVARIAGPGWKPIVLPKLAKSPFPDVKPVDEPGESRTRLPRPLSTTLLKDLHGLTGCQPTPGRIALMDVSYRPTGQVRGVVLADSTTGACAQMAAIVGALEVAPGWEPVQQKRVDRVVVGLRPSDLECEREPGNAQTKTPVLPGGVVKAPVKIRNVAPVYPPVAIERRLQGIVLIEAIIPETGCVADAHVTRRVDPVIDVAALAAVGEWRYRPSTIDGQAVPVIMTVTVNFSLQ